MFNHNNLLLRLYLADSCVALIIIDLDFKVAPGSFLGLLQPADNVFIGFLALYYRQRLTFNLSIRRDILKK